MIQIALRQTQGFINDLLNNNKATFWLLMGSRRAFTWVVPTLWQFIFFAITALAANALFGWLAAQGQGIFNPQGLISYLLWPFIALILGIFLANRRGVDGLMLAPAILWLGADTVVALLQSVIQYLIQLRRLPDWSYDAVGTLYFILFIWQTAALLWVMAKTFHWPWWEQVLVLVAAFSILAVWQKAVISQPMWQIPEPPKLISSDLIYAQPRLLEDALNQVQKSHSTFPNWYFLGVAGAGYQDVFRQDVIHVRNLFEQQFNLFGHVLTLINNTKTFTTEPMATLTSIDRSIARISKQMSTDKDVLVLYLTSHGNTGELELKNDPFEMTSVTPEWLRETLDKHSIKWRIIIVSSCYSGSFIPALQSPTSLVITASAADKTSFGCINHANYTYFGKAFFAHALAQSKSFETAFNTASTELASIEKRLGYEPSEPQIKMGSEMAKALPRLEKNLFAAKLDSTSLADFATTAQLVTPNISK